MKGYQFSFVTDNPVEVFLIASIILTELERNGVMQLESAHAAREVTVPGLLASIGQKRAVEIMKHWAQAGVDADKLIRDWEQRRDREQAN